MTTKPQHPEAGTPGWTRGDTERWLNDYPLPATFMWNGARAYPKYTLKKGYGFWLRTAGPYHPALRGLFVLCHQILEALPRGAPMPSGQDLAACVQRYAAQQGTLDFSPEDLAAPEATNPAENAPGFATARQETDDESPY